MKNSIFVLFFLLSITVFSQKATNKTVVEKNAEITNSKPHKIFISGEIQHPTERKISLTLYRNWVEEEEDYEVKLDKNNQFKFEIKLTDISNSPIAYLDFYYGDLAFHYWIIEENDNIQVVFDAKNIEKTFKISGKGSEKWAYYWQEQHKFESDSTDWHTKAIEWQKLPIDEFSGNLDEEQKRQIAFLDTYKNNVSTDFYETRKADIIGEIQTMKIGYFSSEKGKNMDEEEAKIFLNTSSIATNAAANSLEYGNFQMNIIEMMTEKFIQKNNRKPTDKEQYDFIKSNFALKEIDRPMTERLLAFKLKMLLDESEITPEKKQLVDDYMKFTKNRHYQNYISAKATLRETFKEGSPAKTFSLCNVKDKEISLMAFKGKVILLDFWASWCGPCVYDLTLLDKIQKHFQKNDKFVLIHISIDNEEEWKDAIKQYHIAGINLRTDENSAVTKDYAVSGVPAYFLIDGKGNFATSQVADPSLEDGQALIEQIESFLK